MAFIRTSPPADQQPVAPPRDDRRPDVGPPAMPRPSARPRASFTGGLRAGGAMLVLLGALLWLAGARYTLAGWHVGINWFLAWLGLPVRLPPIVGYGVLLAAPIGVIYSLIELRRPWHVRAPDWQALTLYAIIWLIVVISDGGSTFLGVKQGGAWTVAKQVAASDFISAIWALILTFVPEWFMIGGIRLLRR